MDDRWHSRLRFLITVLAREAEDAERAGYKGHNTLAACAEVLMDLQLDAETHLVHPTSTSGSHSSTTATTSAGDVPRETFHDLREHSAQLPGEAQVAGEVDDYELSDHRIPFRLGPETYRQFQASLRAAKARSRPRRRRYVGRRRFVRRR